MGKPFALLADVAFTVNGNPSALTGYDLWFYQKCAPYLHVMARLSETVRAIDWEHPIQAGE